MMLKFLGKSPDSFNARASCKILARFGIFSETQAEPPDDAL
jgi:hypothetical protein